LSQTEEKRESVLKIQGVSKRNPPKIKTSVTSYIFEEKNSFLLLILITEKDLHFSYHEVPTENYRHCLSIVLLIQPSLSANVALGPAYEG
jgi:hypothetical protein